MEVRAGTVQAYSGGDHTASVQLEGSPTYMSGVPVDRGIAGADVVAGRWCVVVLFDGFYPGRAMVVGIY